MSESKSNPTNSDTCLGSSSAQPSKRKIRRWAWIAALCVILAAAGAFFLHRRTAEESNRRSTRPSPPVPMVSTATARKGDIGVYVKRIASVVPVYTVQVKSRVDGQLMSVNYVEDQLVHSNDSLVEIDPRPYQAQLTQAEGQLERDKALLENAHVDLERYQIAYRSNAIPEQQLATQVATVHQYEGTVKLDQGQVDAARVQVIYCHITAPISGRVGLRLVDPGNIVHATDTSPLAVITQLQPITVEFSPAEDELPEIQKQYRQGQKLVVEAYDRTQELKLATGTLIAIDNQIDLTTGTVKLRALFPNEDNSLFPSQFVNAKLLVRTEHGVTLIPTAAIQHNAQGAFVYVVQTNQMVAVRTVSEGVIDESTGVTAVEGLEPGEIIAADNFNRLLDGVKVAVRTPGEEPKQGGHRVAKAEDESKQGGRKRTKGAAAGDSGP
ncbi:MAG: efflux RND transporter periplasmic adaptor subunit [Limisphaerales bacterium]